MISKRRIVSRPLAPCLSHSSSPSIRQGRLAIKFHPDKNRDDPHAEDRFKEIAIAYQTLSDPALRKRYNEFGPKESAPEGGYVDPEEVFGAIFGGERFIPIIGEISLAKDMKSALQDEDNSEDAPRDAKGREIISPEEKAKREEKTKRVAMEVLKPILVISTCSHTAPYRKLPQGNSASTNLWRPLSAS